ncbi:LysR family transcriptional regulator [Parendozoicomonas haliclonae]|uniref:HTH-type transcriptional regulator DmlR n=1 Tax=Parendozoicomonas haliclonae TaxID=1960125 RepID=A0A1X7AF20_9GAMM|nr:LysR family transcriptional regulator [Parendozoicomonas haliclonae]SMA34448.1 HTH-type transcriptional regulator DmlR [Parendozoicomonas haliclonae]
MKSATFNQLMIFQAIVQQGTIRGAARKLELTPPTVSQTLKQLEQHLGLPLFHRTTRRIELTEAGQQLYQQITGAVATLDFALESVRGLSERPSGKVSITLPRFAYQFFLKPVFAEFCQRYPDVQLEISVSDEAVNILNKGIDVGIRFGDRVEPGMVARQLTAPMREALFASPDYLTRYGIPDNPEELQQHRLVQYRFMASNQLAPLSLHNDGQTTLVQMPLAMIVNDTDAMLDAAAAGLGIGRMVTPMVEQGFSDGTLVPVLESFWMPMSGLYLYFVQNSQKAARVRVLIDYLVEKGRLHHGAS